MTHLQRTWFVQIQGENFGPLSTEVVVLMIQQKRLEYWDFIWTQGLDSWARIADMMPFSEMLPPYPDAPIPGSPGAGTIATTIPNPTQTENKITPPAPAATHSPVPPPAPAPDPEAEKPAPAKKGGTRSLRRHGRARIEGTVAIDGYETYEVYDIAEGGLFVLSAVPVAIGTDIKFKFTSRSFSKVLTMTAVVIREGKTEEGKPGFGIQFTRVNPAISRMIRDYVQNHQE